MASELAFGRPDAQTLEVRLTGDWLLSAPRPSPQDVSRELQARPARRLRFSADGVASWDSGLLTFLQAVQATCKAGSVEVDSGGLPEGVRKLLALAEAVPEKQGARRGGESESWLAGVGRRAMANGAGLVDFMEFLGQLTGAFARFLVFRARYQSRDMWLHMQQCGLEALPIVGLIAGLVGLILAFVGSVQLKQFGAQIYVADLVGLGMAREMGCMMTGIIMAGRTGAAFAAQLGTMKVNEEVDALRTLGIPPMEYLVLPRVLALALMMPLLAIFADIIGIAGGALVSVGMLGVRPTEYFMHTIQAISASDFLIGVIKAAVFGVLVAVAGCQRGMRTSGSASAVGDAATSAVVLGIVAIVVADGLFAVVTSVMGI